MSLPGGCDESSVAAALTAAGLRRPAEPASRAYVKLAFLRTSARGARARGVTRHESRHCRETKTERREADGDAGDVGRTVDQLDDTDGGCTRCSSNGPGKQRGLRAIPPACLMSSSTAPLLVVRWLCSWTEEGRRT